MPRMIVTGTEGSGVNVRAEPDANSPRVGGLPDGAVVQADEHAWRYVRASGIEGWVADEYLEEAPAPPSSTEHFTAEQVASVLGAPLANVQQHLPTIYAALEEYGISDRASTIAALATIGVESGAFLPINEYRNADGSIPNYWYRYGGGPLFHGRGFIQLTHDYNYQHYGDALGVDLLNNPDLALDATIAARVLALYFVEHNIPIVANQNDWYAVRLAVNGGDNGWHHFARLVDGFARLE